ncbi:uncharacterized protein LOC132457504 isoform X2 [Gadus macrocephalus]|uniref:uncharacterized protein LOC132457504 isoform X2 n=1 Tax=Gadus macrocephalus TaxID=80720 RepID=UPI0028CB2702|nr:uncharacterized protein LOC132457504 isoform X2 [Gadus macrocephalus]
MAGSLGVLDIERVVIAAVRAALQGVAPPVQSTSATVSTPAVPSASGTSNFATTVTSLRSGEHTLISKEDIEGLLLLGNRTPVQLFTLDRHLLLLNYPESAAEERTVDSVSTPLAHYSFCPLNQQDLQELVITVNPLENDGNKGKTLYHRVQEFVLHKIVNM